MIPPPSMLGQVATLRRYVRSKLLAAREIGSSTEWAWLAKLNAAVGTPLVGAAPTVLARLLAADPPYSMVEDVYGASVDELRERAHLTRAEAVAVLTLVDSPSLEEPDAW